MTEAEKILEYVKECDEEYLYPTGMEEAIIGLVQKAGERSTLLLDREKCIQILMEDMDRDEAEEFFEFNVIGSFMGEGTPSFAILAKDL